MHLHLDAFFRFLELGCWKQLEFNPITGPSFCHAFARQTLRDLRDVGVEMVTFGQCSSCHVRLGECPVC